ncbi:cytochrome P450 [Acephala macrosclerotiorum]|nr:cytochrome P450 [Acephala macrosclerotiorum]
MEKRADIWSSRPRLIAMGDLINATEINQTTLVYGNRWRVYGKSMVPLAIMQGVNFVVPGKFLMEAVAARTKLPSWIYASPSILRGSTTMLPKYSYMLSQGAESKWNNFSRVLLNGQETYGLSDVEVAGLTANLIGGGVDTTSSTMISCILAMAVFPDGQKKAQAEIDSVIGDNTSPSWDDIDGKLPYCAALVREALRWRTVTVLAGIPHANLVDFEFRGYHFPAGTGNIWVIHRHPRDFPGPDNFRPERFLNGLKRPNPNNKGMNPFRWGRRQCSGLPLAEQGLLYSLTRLLWVFNIEPGLDANIGLKFNLGNEVKLDFSPTRTVRT